MIARLLPNLSPRRGLSVLLGILFLIAVLSFGSYALPEKDLTGRRGPVAFIPREARLALAAHRNLAGGLAAGGAGLLAAGWIGAETLSRVWQKRRNEELAANAILVRLAPRADDKNPWAATAGLWRAIHSTLARPAMQTWLGGGLHLSFEIARIAGDQIAFYLWAPRPLAQTMVEQFSALYPGLEVEALNRNAAEGAGDYLDRALADSGWVWADLGLGREAWRSLRTEFAIDPLASLLSPLRGLSSGNDLAAVHFIIRPAAGNQMAGGNQFIARLRGDNLPKGDPRPRLTTPDRALIKQIEEKGRSPGYDLCLRLVVAGKGDTGGDLERLIRAFDQFGDDNSLAVRRQGNQSEAYRFRGRFLPAGWRASVVGEKELAALAHLPNGALTGLPIDRAGVQVEEPSPVSFIQPGEERVTLDMYVGLPAFGRGLDALAYPFSLLRRLLVKNEEGKGKSSEEVRGKSKKNSPLLTHPSSLFPLNSRERRRHSPD